MKYWIKMMQKKPTKKEKQTLYNYSDSDYINIYFFQLWYIHKHAKHEVMKLS